jgi:hypothetical protein
MNPPTEALRAEDIFVLPDGSALVPRLVIPSDSWGQWRRLLDLLVSGTRVPVSAESARYLLETRPVRSESRAGFVVDVHGRLVRLWTDDGAWWGEVLPSPFAPDAACHDVVCVSTPSDWGVLVCVCCGRAW